MRLCWSATSLPGCPQGTAKPYNQGFNNLSAAFTMTTTKLR
jgi:hypothetical protein